MQRHATRAGSQAVPHQNGKEKAPVADALWPASPSFSYFVCYLPVAFSWLEVVGRASA